MSDDPFTPARASRHAPAVRVENDVPAARRDGVQRRDATARVQRQAAEFELLLQRGRASTTGGEGDGDGMDCLAVHQMDEALLAPASSLDAIGTIGSAAFNAPLFGATSGTATRPRRPALPASSTLGLSGSQVRARRAGGETAKSPNALAAPPSVATWELVQELVQNLHVTQPRRAQHAAVHLELKGRLVRGTHVVLSRQGHRLSVEIVPGGADAWRELSQQVEALQEVMARSAPDCHVAVNLQDPSSREFCNEP